MEYIIRFDVPEHLDHLWRPDERRRKWLEEKTAEFLNELVMREMVNEVERLRLEPRIEDGSRPEA